MPELPEVETIRLGLQKYIVGKTVRDVEVRLPKIISGDPKDIIGAKVIDVIPISNRFAASFLVRKRN